MIEGIPQDESGFLAALIEAVAQGHVEVDLDAYQRHRARHPNLRSNRAGKLRRTARSKGATVIETVHLDVVWLRDRGQCALCGKPVRLFGGTFKATGSANRASLDHKQPLAKGGQHTYANSQLAHVRCNQDKGSDWAG